MLKDKTIYSDGQYDYVIIVDPENSYMCRLVSLANGKATKWVYENEIEEIIKKKRLTPTNNIFYEPAPMPVNNNNFNLSGDEARLILTALLAESIKFSGNMIPMILSLVQRLNEINLNQPPKG